MLIKNVRSILVDFLFFFLIVLAFEIVRLSFLQLNYFQKLLVRQVDHSRAWLFYHLFLALLFLVFMGKIGQVGREIGV